MTKHSNVTPTLCTVCGEPIPCGTGLFIAEPEGARFAHSGACALAAGAFPGGGAKWGEISALASHMIAHDGMSPIEAAEAVRFREKPEEETT